MDNEFEGFRLRLIASMAEAGLRAVDLCERTGIPKSAMSHYMGGRYFPRQDRLYLISKALGVSPMYLMCITDEKEWDDPNEPPKSNQTYYADKKTAETAQALKTNKELALLFDAAKDASPEDLRTVHTMLLALKRKDNKE